MKHFLLLFIFISFASLSFSQTTWNVAIPYETADHLNVVKKMIKTHDDGFLILLDEFLENGGGFRKRTHSMLKYNIEGELLWGKYYDFGVSAPIPNNDWGGGGPIDIVQLDNGNFFMTGKYSDIDTSFYYVFVTDENGDSLSFMAAEMLYPEDLSYVNGRIFVRTWDSLDNNIFIELNEVGDKIYQLDLMEDVVWITFVNENMEIFLGRGLGINGSMKKITLEGEVLNEVPSFGNFIDKFVHNELNGFTSYRDNLIKVDNDLNEVWSVPFEEIFPGESSSEFNGSDIIRTSDNGYLVIGNYCVDPYFPCRVYKIKFDEEGTEEWGSIYSYSYLPLEHIQNIVEINDGYVYVGTNSFTEKIWLVKVNQEGLFTATEDIENKALGVVLYPNPARDNIKLEFQNTFSGVIRIWNVVGELMHEEKITSSDFYDHQISVYPDGYYTVQLVNDEKQVQTLRFINL